MSARHLAGVFGLTLIVITAQVTLGACAGSGEGLDKTGRPIPADAMIVAGDTSVDGDIDGAATATLTAIQEQVFTPTCTGDGCHIVGVAPLGLILQSGFSYGGLVGISSGEAFEMIRVVPSDPDESYLMVKIVAEDPRNRDRRMPRDGPPFLDDAQIEMIRSWIAAGAQDD